MSPIRLAILVLVLVPAAAMPQSLGRRVAQAKDGSVRFSFAARPGICGDGRSIIGDGRNIMRISRDNFSISDENTEGCPCEPGPVRVSLAVRRGRAADLRTYVAGHWPTPSSATDLGMVPAAQAVDYLLSLATGRDEEVGKDAIFPASLADSVVVWPELLRIARQESVPEETRHTAVFWVSQAAGVAATQGLDSLVTDPLNDRDIREQAVFALSQRPRDEGIPVLIRIARTNRDPAIRRRALFWLGQSDDPRSLALFEEILTQR